MTKIHACLKHEMAAFREAERQPDLLLLLDIMDYLRTYSDGFHHPLEDRAYVRMRLLLDESFLIQMLDRIEVQHAWMHVLSRRLEGHFEAIANGQVTPLTLLLEDYCSYIDIAVTHIACENQYLLPALERYLLPQHLEEIMAEVGAVEDPLFGGEKRDVYERLYERIISSRGIPA